MRSFGEDFFCVGRSKAWVVNETALLMASNARSMWSLRILERGMRCVDGLRLCRWFC